MHDVDQNDLRELPAELIERHIADETGAEYDGFAPAWQRRCSFGDKLAATGMMIGPGAALAQAPRP